MKDGSKAIAHRQEVLAPITLDNQIRIGNHHMAELNLKDGDIVIIEGRERHRRAARCFGIEHSGDYGLSTFVFMNRSMRDSLDCCIGDLVWVTGLDEFKGRNFRPTFDYFPKLTSFMDDYQVGKV